MQVGDKKGALTITAEGQRGKYGGRPHAFWWVRCECGNVECLPAHKVYKYDCCRICQRGPCVICGGKILSGNKKTCSDGCFDKHRKNKFNLAYAQLISSDPEFNKKRAAKVRQKIAANPELKQKHLENERERSGRYRSKNRIKLRTRYNEMYQKKGKEIQDRRKRLSASLSEEERIQKLIKRREYDKNYRREWREKINNF